MKEKKNEALEALSESELRSRVLVPLLEDMGFTDVMEYHGLLEFGKDIVFYDKDRFGDRVFYAIVAKKGRIHGSVSKSGSMSEVVYQAEQALGEPWLDPSRLTRHRIDKVIIAASGTITHVASMSIAARLQDKPVRFLDGNKIVELIDKYAPGIWERIRSDSPPELPTVSLREALEQAKVASSSQERGRDLEQLVKRLFEKMEGFVDVVTNVRSSVEEIDLMFRNESSDAFWNQQGPFVMVECKSWSKKVGRAELDVFASKMSRRARWCRLGFFVSLSGFSREFSLSLRQYISSNVLVVPIDLKRLEMLCDVGNPKELLKEYIFDTLNT